MIYQGLDYGVTVSYMQADVEQRERQREDAQTVFQALLPVASRAEVLRALNAYSMELMEKPGEGAPGEDVAYAGYAGGVKFVFVDGRLHAIELP